MNLSLFEGGRASVSSPRRAPDAERPPDIPRGPQRGRPQHYFTHDGRCFSLDRLRELSGWEDACARYPDHDIVILFDSTDPDSRLVGLIAVPREQPARQDARGRPLPPARPFWGHGDVMHIRRDKPPP